ncbi:MAG: glutathione S-transferase [Myxococcales bacterium]
MTTPARPIRLYRHPLSGHAHRVELMLSLLGLPFESIDVDLAKGAQREPAFLAKNPWGQVPVIEDGELTLSDSNAILVYLVTRYDPEGPWLPRDALGAARVQHWFSIAAGQLAYGPGALRRAALFRSTLDEVPARALAQQLLTVVEAELAHKPFLASERATLADVAMYSYLKRAPEGGVSLADHPRLRDWLARVEALPGFVPMPGTRTHHVERLERQA